MNNKKLPSREDIAASLEYNPDTGEIRYAETHFSWKRGKPVESERVTIKGYHPIPVKELVWCLETGAFPNYDEGERVWHLDTNFNNYQFSNLIVLPGEVDYLNTFQRRSFREKFYVQYAHSYDLPMAHGNVYDALRCYAEVQLRKQAVTA